MIWFLKHNGILYYMILTPRPSIFILTVPTHYWRSTHRNQTNLISVYLIFIYKIKRVALDRGLLTQVVHPHDTQTHTNTHTHTHTHNITHLSVYDQRSRPPYHRPTMTPSRNDCLGFEVLYWYTVIMEEFCRVTSIFIM